MKRFLLLLSIIAMGVFCTSASTAVFYASGSTDYPSDADAITEIKNSATSGVLLDESFTNDVGTITFSKGTSSVDTYVTGNQVRWYANAVITFAPAENVTIKQIVFHVTGSSYAKSTTASAGTTDYSTTDLTITWTGSSEESFTIKTSAQVRFTYIKITYTKADASQKNADISFSDATATAELGQAFTAPTFNNPNNLTVTFSSDDTDVASVDSATGEVIVKAAGTTTIKAHSDATTEFREGNASYTLSVIDPSLSWSLVTDAGSLGQGDKIIIINQAEAKAISTESNTNNRKITDVTLTSDKSQVINPSDKVMVFEVGGTTDAWTFKTTNYQGTGGYLGTDNGTGSNNYAKIISTYNTSYCDAKVNINSTTGVASIVFPGKRGTLRFNSTLFSCYASTSTGTDVYIYRYAYGTQLPAPGLSFDVETVKVNSNESVTAPTLNNPNNLEVTYSSTNTELATVDASTGAITLVKDAYGECSIIAAFAGNDQFTRGSAKYTLIVSPTATSVADFITKGAASSTMEMAITFPLTVAHCDGSSRVWATDGTHWILIYKYSIGSFKRGDVIPAGWSATYTNYNGIHEMVPVDAVPAATSTADITIATANAADITTDDVNKVLLLENITFSAATAETGAFTGVDAQGNTVSFYNGLKLASVAAGTYNVEIAVSINSSKPSLYPISFTAVPTIALGNYAFTAKPYVLGDETVNDLTLTIDSFVDNVKRGDDATYQLVMTADQASQVIATCDAATKALVAEHLAYNEDATYAINVVDGDNTTAYDLDITSPYINLWLGDITDNATLNYVNDAANSNVDAYIEIAFASVAVAEEEALINSLIFTPYVSCPDFENATLQAVDGKKLTYNVVVPAFLTNIPVENGALKLTADDFIGHEGVGGNIYCGYKFLTVVNDEYVANETLFNGDDEGFKFFETLNTSTPTNGVSGIADITTDANAPVEYYNLAGLRLNTPTAPGIYLRRQGTQVSKIIIK